MNRETQQPTLRTPNPGQMPDVLAQLQSSGSIHFWKVLRKTAIPRPTVRQHAKLSVPKEFVQDHGGKFKESVTLRVRTSNGRSSMSWPAHCCVAAKLEVAIVGGWPAFAFDNRLKLGDFVIFVLREDAISEFEVQVFRGPGNFPDQGGRSYEFEEEEEHGSSDTEKEEQAKNISRVASPVHQQDERNQVFRRDIGEENPTPFQQTGNPRVPPRFSKRLMASDIGGSSGEFNAGQSEFPISKLAISSRGFTHCYLHKMNRETQPTPNPGQAAQMPDVLAQLQSSGSIHFWKVLRKTAIHRPADNQTARVSVPEEFVQDHGGKFKEWVQLRVRTSRGRSSRSWPAHCWVAATLNVAIVGGWSAFASDNRLKLGDFVVFVLREDAISEFEVQVFRGPGKFPYFPDQGERSDRDIGEENLAPFQQTGNPREPPRFSKRLKASDIGGSFGEFNAGQSVSFIDLC